MYHYLFTNDLRISTLDASLCDAGRCFITDTVPSASENKSANNNMKTLGFYFNLTKDSVCAREAAEGNIRAVVFNFIKKFQFPNLRTQECFDKSIKDGITLAPMRVIIKILYTMNILYGSSSAYLTREEIKNFVFYNSAVAKTKSPDFIALINGINEYRLSGILPDTISVNTTEHEWKQEDRQIREMVKILKWSGCVAEENEKIYIANDGLSQENKAAVFDIVNYYDFWDGNTIEDYRKYMDMTGEEIILFDEQRYIDNKREKKTLTEEELSSILSEMYTSSDSEKNHVVAIHIFGIKYGKEIIENGYSIKNIIYNAGLSDSYSRELYKGLNIYKCFNENTFGIAFKDNEPKESVCNEDRVMYGENTLYYGVPGSGKSFTISQKCSDEKYMERVVFHPDYTYSDFVGQILPRLNKDNKLEYVFTAGPFTRVLKKAYDDPKHMYYLIIEEINRGNAPAIFGEIFQLLDRDKNGSSEYGISNYDVAKEVHKNSEKSVRIPSNLSILATMNTSDQNVFTLDTAFQRRWKMKHIPNKFNDDQANTFIQGTHISWSGFATVINDMVEDSSVDISGSGDKRLGAYFVGEDELSADVFPEKVLKYLWDDAFRMDKDTLFGEQYKSLECIIENYKKETGDRLQAVIRTAVYKKMLQRTGELRANINVVGEETETNEE